MAGPAHSRASSGGESRLTRAAYGKDAIYTRMALDSLTQWQALSDVSGLPIFHPTGILFFFPTDEPYFHDSVAAHRELKLPSEARPSRHGAGSDADSRDQGRMWEPRSALMPVSVQR